MQSIMYEDKARKENKLKIWIARIYLILVAFQGFAVLYILIRIPAEPDVIGLFGFSLSRLAMIMVVALITLTFIWLVLRSFRDTDWLLIVISHLESWLNRKNNFGISLLSDIMCNRGELFHITGLRCN